MEKLNFSGISLKDANFLNGVRENSFGGFEILFENNK